MIQAIIVFVFSEKLISTPTLLRLEIAIVCWFMKIGLQNWNLFDVKEFLRYFGFKNGFKQEFSSNNENFWSQSKNKLSNEIHFTAFLAHESMPTAG